MEEYKANPQRYSAMQYRRCGASSLKLPIFSLGLWHDFGSVDDFDEAGRMIRLAFDNLKAMDKPGFIVDELEAIEKILQF